MLPDWTPFQRTVPVHRITGQPRPLPANTECYGNSRYTVLLRRYKATAGNAPDVLHLSFHRHDRAAIRDWREVMRIKNEIVGPEYEFVELYPAMSRIVDQANEYHLWGFDDPTYRFPFGESDGVQLGDEHDADAVGAVQRPLPRWMRRQTANK